MFSEIVSCFYFIWGCSNNRSHLLSVEYVSGIVLNFIHLPSNFPPLAWLHFLLCLPLASRWAALWFPKLSFSPPHGSCCQSTCFSRMQARIRPAWPPSPRMSWICSFSSRGYFILSVCSGSEQLEGHLTWSGSPFQTTKSLAGPWVSHT